MIGPWLIAQARARVAERNLRHSSNAERPVAQALPVNLTHAQIGDAK